MLLRLSFVLVWVSEAVDDDAVVVSIDCIPAHMFACVVNVLVDRVKPEGVIPEPQVEEVVVELEEVVSEFKVEDEVSEFQVEVVVSEFKSENVVVESDKAPVSEDIVAIVEEPAESNDDAVTESDKSVETDDIDAELYDMLADSEE